MTLIPEHVESYFATARARHQIYLNRRAGRLRPWTEDPILADWRFCNVFRELDRTTAWFHDNVRERLRSRPEVLLATVVFRLFNRISTGEAIFCQRALGLDDELPGETAWEAFLRTGDVGYLRASIYHYIGDRGPYVTGSYIIKTPEGHSKLEGVLQIIEWFYQRPADLDDVRTMEWWLQASSMSKWTLEKAAVWLESTFRLIGHFTAYEIVSDLRHTDLLCHAEDVMTWANPGPGATRGLNYLHGREWGKAPPKTQLVYEMGELLALSQDCLNWPTEMKIFAKKDGTVTTEHTWPSWEMREVEHWLCEAYKYWRMRDGGTTPRQRFRG